LGGLVDSTLAWLQSDEACAMLDATPYWPKWNGPWWQTLMLVELGFGEKIPDSALERLQHSAKNTWMNFFPLLESELPTENFHPYVNTVCHCALGSMIRFCLAAGFEPMLHFDWMEWFSKYQLPDGGWNCDEAVYTGSKKSSVVSTVAVLDAFLEYGYGNLLAQTQRSMVDRGISYLIDRKLIMNSAQSKIAAKAWKLAIFPRFYELDSLRALTCVVRWSRQSGKILEIGPLELVVQDLITSVSENNCVFRKRIINEDDGTMVQSENGEWEWKGSGSPGSFPLLDFVNQNPTIANWYLSCELLDNLRFLESGYHMPCHCA